MYLIDYHLHTSFSMDSEAKIEKVVEKAINKNLNSISITDHLDFNKKYYEIIDFKKYFLTLENLKEKYKNKIDISIGVEIGLDHSKKSEIELITKENNFDFIIGSAHQTKGLDHYYDRKKFFSNKTKSNAYKTYFLDILENISSIENFCVHGHLDYISRYGTYEDNSLFYKDYKELIDTILKTLISKNKGIEINTSGFRYNINSTYPQLDIIKAYKSFGGEIITVGSDSHKVEDVGKDVEKAYSILKALDFKYITTFKNLEPIFHKLN